MALCWHNERLIQDSDNVLVLGSGLKGGIVPSSSDVSGFAVRQEQDGGKKKKKRQNKWSRTTGKTIKLGFHVSKKRCGKRNMQITQGLKNEALNRHLKLASLSFVIRKINSSTEKLVAIVSIKADLGRFCTRYSYEIKAKDYSLRQAFSFVLHPAGIPQQS